MAKNSDKSKLTLAELELLLRDQIGILERWIADAHAMLSEVTRLLIAIRSTLESRDKPHNET
jgi:hypothetical protein